MLSACLLGFFFGIGQGMHIILVFGLGDHGQPAQEKLQQLCKCKLFTNTPQAEIISATWHTLLMSAVLLQKSVVALQIAMKPENSLQRVILPTSIINKDDNELGNKLRFNCRRKEENKNHQRIFVVLYLASLGMRKKK